MLDLAVTDARSFQATEGCRLDKGLWLEFRHLGTGDECVACMAGAVMARTLRVATEPAAERELEDGPDGPKIIAIDLLRTGDVCRALLELGRQDTAQAREMSARYRAEFRAVWYTTALLPWERYTALAVEMRGLGL